MAIKVTHTYAVLDISKEAYQEIRRLLEEAGYSHAFHKDDERPEVIDMHGIAIAAKPD